MAKSKLTNQEQVTAYIHTLEPLQQELLSYLRQFILAIDTKIAEHIKWNSLSFYYTGEMKAFDAKTYQSDILVCNLHRGKILLVFPTGAKIKDNLKGKDYPDGRKIITFNDFEEIKLNEDQVKQIIIDWISVAD